MKKSVVKFFQIVAVFSLLFLAACSGSAINSSSGSDDSSKESEGDSKDPVKLGFILSLTGNFASMGTPVKEGIELYFEENPEIDGRKIELFFEDDAGDPQAALRKYEQLTLNQGVHIVGGGTVGSIALALRDKVDTDKKVPLINVVGSTDVLSWEKKSDYAWRTSFSAWQYASISGKFTAEAVGKNAVIIASDYVAGHEIVTDFIPSFEEGGGKVKEIIWAPLGTSDFSSYLTQIDNAKPEAVFMFIPGADGSRLVKQYQEFGLQDKYTLVEGGSLLNAPFNVKAVGNAVVGGKMITNYFPELKNEVNEKFVKAYQAKFNKIPDNYVVNGYDTGNLIAQVVGEAGSLNGEKVVSVLKKGLTLDSPRGPIEMNPDTHTLNQNMYVIEGKEANSEISFELIKTYENIEMPKENVGYKKY
ncbi:ABC transporter substrate-binding protein [Bacillus sp. OK048]|uniref:ABC transporter substrate-binding protein n=1 Tax=Bacillus sp. OK048 TaxID=1882761 RepID=UPI00088A0C55|nr:ABC transporter substrate-binding protein [Bacillus sp. OK048]SDL87790.1 amino acid/amide ABC transporter substrate-binding protein, HAAT family [Bacillus sp. OK048]